MGAPIAFRAASAESISSGPTPSPGIMVHLIFSSPLFLAGVVWRAAEETAALACVEAARRLPRRAATANVDIAFM